MYEHDNVGFQQRELEDRLAILELTGRLALTIDARDWNALGQLFTDPAYHDRTSLTGGSPTTLPVAEFVEGWRQTLQNMDAVSHQITNHVISLDADRATCAANIQGTRVLANASGGPMWPVRGRHGYQLKWTPRGWRIAGLTFTLQWATGNTGWVAGSEPTALPSLQSRAAAKGGIPATLGGVRGRKEGDQELRVNGQSDSGATAVYRHNRAVDVATAI